MRQSNKNQGSGLTLAEAVEKLSQIADLEITAEGELLRKPVSSEKPLPQRSIHWLQYRDVDQTMKVIKDTFRTVLDYLHFIDSQEYTAAEQPAAFERIKAMMGLVGDAAKKLDRYKKLFRHNVASVVDLQEYRELQEFFLNRLAPRVVKMADDLPSHLVAGIAEGQAKLVAKHKKKERDAVGKSKHTFVDLELIRQDSAYELFFLRREDGGRFFNPRLIQNIKLVSNFGTYVDKEKQVDPLADLKEQQELVVHHSAKHILRSARRPLEKFLKHAKLLKKSPLAQQFKKALMALMLAASPANLNGSKRNCIDYFKDFQELLQGCLKMSDYHKLVVYRPHKNDLVSYITLNAIEVSCMALYTQLGGFKELVGWVHSRLYKAHVEFPGFYVSATKHPLWEQLKGDYQAFSRWMKWHPNGAVVKLLEAIQEDKCKEFTPIRQGNLPSQLFSLYLPGSKCSVVRLPSPTQQECIHKAAILDEFKAFLRACNHESKIRKCLIINLQDRCSWQEEARSFAIEELGQQGSFSKHLFVATIPKDGDFYHQLGDYAVESFESIAFIDKIKQLLLGHEAGQKSACYYSPSLKKQLSPSFVEQACQIIWTLFFGARPSLNRQERLNFIEMIHFFLQLKMIDLIQPDLVGILSKDGLDTAVTNSASLYVISKLIQQGRLSESDREYLDLLLYAPIALYRERLLLKEGFKRMVHLIKAFEEVREVMGQAGLRAQLYAGFKALYSMPMLQAKMLPSLHKDEL